MLFVSTAQIVETQRSQLQEFLLRTEIVPNWLVEQHVDAFRDEVELLGEVQPRPLHDFNADFVDERSEFWQQG